MIEEKATRSGLSSTFGPKVGLYLSGASGNYVSAPDSAALDITGDIDLIWHGALDNWNTGAVQALVGKYNATGNQRSFLFYVDVSGDLTMQWSTNGNAGGPKAYVNASSVLTNGEAIWLRATLDVDNGASGWTVRFYHSSDGVKWSQISSTQTSTPASSIHSGTSPLEIGTYESGLGLAAGTVRRAIVKDGIDGTVVADWRGDVPADRYRDAYGNVYTLAGTNNAWVEV